jgi:hypothetical protein
MEPVELPCARCRVLTPVDFLIDAADLAPFPGQICEACELELGAELHDECECTCCEHLRSKQERIRRMAEARTYGGLSRDGLVLLGWTRGGE